LQASDSARAAGLRYLCDDAPGIRRVRAGKGFRYLAPDGKPLRDAGTLARIRALAVPPAWRDVWICPRDDGHIQATGRDARGRKQYRYHRRWREVRDETKYGRMLAFAIALPRIRRRVQHDLSAPGLPREKVLATVVRLLESTRIRVGNEEYARQNASFGLTTLRERQVRVRGGTLKFRFRGKSGVRHDIELNDRQLAAIVRHMQDLPGEVLFQYVDETGERRPIESADVNAYLQEAAGEEFTSKDFRTWAGTVLAARALAETRNVKKAIERVAKLLGNTQAVCRKCYLHPAVLEGYKDESLLDALPRNPPRAARNRPFSLDAHETAVLRLLHEWSRRERELARRSGAGGRSLVPVLALTARHLRKPGTTQPAARGATQ
jgi:DNA topoisomerase-1